ncbi:MAG TPA: CBS domain-containing protein [Solirubrobacteraceae bacterium]|nr:CBS domain-containing protein [Solirubrobacteraceae bacterium]
MTTVAEIMERDPIKVAPDDDIESVLHLMREHELPGVPVVNDGGRCVGIVTEADLVLRDEGSDLHLPHYIALFGGVVFLEPLKRFESRLRKAVASKAADMMTEDPDTIGPDASVEQAAREIATRKHNRLPVVEHGRLVGVVTRLDVLEALTAQ